MGIFRRSSAQTPSSTEGRTTNLVGSMVEKLGSKVDAEIDEHKRLRTNSKIISQHLSAIERSTEGIVIAQGAQVLRDGEEVLFAAIAKEAESGITSILVATEARIFIAYTKSLNFAHVELPYSAIDRIDLGRNLRGCWISLWSNAQMIQLEKSSQDFEPLKEIIRKRQGSAAQPTSASHTSAEASNLDESMEQIKKLADLRAQGILSDEEFAAAKAKALGL
ncbi:hypothetical protein CCICO_01790 [Corynebacterium ciconiae DSM 44920]|uniref:SHOCT domain-containing protein n=1 Tax=Corynebacterium ciconiae TaxID=227319 RepID=UPI00036FD29A|nr:SHOCT domain-containing protein [Corynebacterium ciconiae]WKD60410.1 hypothetical protein CCICO_01790 [Corynebacterium ciconiae DSM 44920]